MPPRSGLERSDFVPWPDSEVAECADDFRFLGYSGLVVLTARLSESDPIQPFASANLSMDHSGSANLR